MKNEIHARSRRVWFLYRPHYNIVQCASRTRPLIFIIFTVLFLLIRYLFWLKKTEERDRYCVVTRRRRKKKTVSFFPPFNPFLRDVMQILNVFFHSFISRPIVHNIGAPGPYVTRRIRRRSFAFPSIILLLLSVAQHNLAVLLYVPIYYYYYYWDSRSATKCHRNVTVYCIINRENNLSTGCTRVKRVDRCVRKIIRSRIRTSRDNKWSKKMSLKQ